MDERRPPSRPTGEPARPLEVTRFVKKLTAAQVKAIKRAFKAGVPMTRLARRLGVAI